MDLESAFNMFSKIICLYLVILCVYAAPPADKVPLEKQQPTVIPIISQSEELESNGTYKFSYETGNGITREEVSYDKILPKSKSASSKDGKDEDSDESNEIHVQKGSYSYTAPDGTVITVRYIADENGFRPIGDHFPKPPSIAAARAGKKGRKADLNHEESKSTLAQANNRPNPSLPQSPQEAALESDLNSESINSKSKSEKPVTPNSASPTKSSTESAASESSTSEGTGSETSVSEASTTEVSTSEASTTDESKSEISTSEATSEASEPSSTEASTSDALTTEASTGSPTASDASTTESSTPEVSSTPESNTTELASSTVAEQTTTESSTTSEVTTLAST